jgi:hypothetical protein
VVLFTSKQITMTSTRPRKRGHWHVTKQIQRSQVLAFIAKNDIDHCTVPVMPTKDAQPSSVEDCVHQGQEDEGGVAETQFDNDFESFAAS